jgi:hypothetical protein
MNMLSADSRCFSFDERGNGYARGEGVGVLILKRLSDAIRDGDTIRAVIRSTGSNHDGFTPGITQPNPKSQELLIRECYAKAGLDMSRTGFFEAHGTGTPVGDVSGDFVTGPFFIPSTFFFWKRRRTKSFSQLKQMLLVLPFEKGVCRTARSTCKPTLPH